MKQILVVAILTALPATAQWRHFGGDGIRPAGFIGVGFAEPVNPLARNLDPGWSLAGGIGGSGEYVGVLVDAMFTDFGLNHSTLLAAGVPRGDQKYWAITVDPILHVNQRGPVDFYLTGGAGIYSRTTEYRMDYGIGGPFSGRGDLLGSDTIYKPGVDGGAGFSFNLGYSTRVKVFAEARFHHMFTHGSGSSFIPVTVGIRF